MFRVWSKLFHENHLIKDTTIIIEDPPHELTRTKKVFTALEETCRQFDLAPPIWLDVNIREFKRYAKTRFHKDSFMEPIDFDYLEFHIIEEDERD